MSKMKRIFNFDGWKNILTGQGVSGKDRHVNGDFAADRIITEDMARNLYRNEGFSRRVVDLRSKEMVREWFNISGDTSGEVNSDLFYLDTKKVTMKALQQAFTYGGSLMLMVVNDGGTFEDELREDSIQEIEELRVYQRHRVTWMPGDLESDPEKKRYGKPKYYRIYPIVSVPTVEIKVHWSRVLIFDGMDVDDLTRQNNEGWGDSIYQSLYRQLEDLGNVYYSGKNIIEDFIQTVISIDNLQELIVSGNDKVVKDRLNILDLSRHIMNTAIIDTNEKYEKKASSVSGLDMLMDRYALALSAVTGTPYTLLMGQAPAGLSATGASDIRFWYDNIRSEQVDRLQKNMEIITRLVMLSKSGPTGGKEIENWSIEFNPLWQPTEKERAETRKMIAETDAIYINTGVLTPGEVAVSRFGGDEYSPDLLLEDVSIEERDSLLPIPEEEDVSGPKPEGE